MPAERSAIPARRASKILPKGRQYTIRNDNIAAKHAAGLYDSPSVQDRIRQWQAQGAANALDPDTVSVRSIPISECPSANSRPRSLYGDDRSEEHTSELQSR